MAFAVVEQRQAIEEQEYRPINSDELQRFREAISGDLLDPTHPMPGGGNFGVVTSFVFRLHRVGPDVATLTPFLPLDDGRRVLFAWRDFTEDAPEETTTAHAVWAAPDDPDVPERLRGQPASALDGM